MVNFFSIDSIFFTFLGYPMSYIEFVGTILYLWSVWLISQKRMLNWPVGIASVILYGMLFYQIQLYSDCLEQIYYLGASTYGWWYWSRERRDTREIAVRRGTRLNNLLWLGAIALLSGTGGFLMARIHLFLPALFPLAADFPYLDAFTTVASFAAMYLLARKRTESWLIWIVVDVIAIGLYWIKEVKFLSLLYVILLILAVRGYLSWKKEGISSPYRRMKRRISTL